MLIASALLVPIGAALRFGGDALTSSVGFLMFEAGTVSLTAAVGARVLTLGPQERNQRTLELLAFTCSLAMSVAFLLRHIGVLTVSVTVYVAVIGFLAIAFASSMFWSAYRYR